jgi:hypothetical protein
MGAILDNSQDRREIGRTCYAGATYLTNAGIPVWIDDATRRKLLSYRAPSWAPASRRTGRSGGPLRGRSGRSGAALVFNTIYPEQVAPVGPLSTHVGHRWATRLIFGSGRSFDSIAAAVRDGHSVVTFGARMPLSEMPSEPGRKC